MKQNKNLSFFTLDIADTKPAVHHMLHCEQKCCEYYSKIN